MPVSCYSLQLQRKVHWKNYGHSPGLYTRRFIIKRQLRRETSLEQKKKRGFKRKLVISNPEDDYGAVEEQISDEELKSRKDKLENILKKISRRNCSHWAKYQRSKLQSLVASGENLQNNCVQFWSNMQTEGNY